MLKYKAVFDNSANNPLNPNPDKEVYWSEQSWDEMSLGWIEYTLDKQRLPSSRYRKARAVAECRSSSSMLAALLQSPQAQRPQSSRRA